MRGMLPMLPMLPAPVANFQSIGYWPLVLATFSHWQHSYPLYTAIDIRQPTDDNPQLTTHTTRLSSTRLYVFYMVKPTMKPLPFHSTTTTINYNFSPPLHGYRHSTVPARTSHLLISFISPLRLWRIVPPPYTSQKTRQLPFGMKKS